MVLIHQSLSSSSPSSITEDEAVYTDGPADFGTAGRRPRPAGATATAAGVAAVPELLRGFLPLGLPVGDTAAGASGVGEG